MSQKYLNNKNPKIRVGGAIKRQNRPTARNMNKTNISHRQLHKNSARIGKLIETEMASKVGGSQGYIGNGGSLNILKVDKNVLGRMNAKKGKKNKKNTNSALAK